MQAEAHKTKHAWLPSRLALLVNAVVVCIAVALVFWHLDGSYREVLARASIVAQGLTQEKARALQTQFEVLDLLLDRLLQKIPEHALTAQDLIRLQQQFESDARLFPLVTRLLLIGPEEQVVVANSLSGLRGKLSRVCVAPDSERAWTKDIYIARMEPVLEDGQHCTIVAGIHYGRQLRDQQGNPRYELLAVLDTGMLGAGFFNEVTWALGDKASYRIARSDGHFLVGFQHLPAGLRYGLEPSFARAPYSLFSHKDAAGAIAEISGHDLVVETAYSNNEVLRGEWRESVITSLVAAGVFLFTWLAFSWFVTRLLRRHESMLQEGEQRFNRSLSYASVGAWEWDVASGSMYWSDEMYALLRCEKGSVEPDYRTLLGLVHPDDRQVVQDILGQQGHDDFELFVRLRWPDGSTRWMQLRGGIRRTESGLPQNVSGILADISEQYRAQHALAESESRFRAAFDSTAVGNIIINADGVIVDANHAAEKIFGYGMDELIGQNVSMLMPAQHADRHDQYLQAFDSERKSPVIGQGVDVQGVRKDGRLFPMHLAVGVMEIGGMRTFIGSISDLSDIHSLEHQLRHSQKMDAVGQLAGGVAHDFNNILGIAIGGLDLLKMRLAGQAVDERVMALLDKVHQSLWRGAKMTKNLLDFARQDQGVEAACRLDELVQDSLELISKSLTSSIRVDAGMAPDTWPVKVNPDDFQNALINLSINARDAMPQGGVLRLYAQNISLNGPIHEGPAGLAPGDYVRFSVADTGMGMSDAVRDKVFEPFFSTKEKGKGTGLGLSMVYSFVKRAGGIVEIESDLGRGACFHLYLPRAEDAPEGRHVTEVSSPGEDEIIANGETVLVVDDEQYLAEVACEMLTGLGFTPLTLCSSTEALRLIEQGELDIRLLFSDIVMPELDGIHLALAAHRCMPELPILLTSGYAQDVMVDCEDPGEEAWARKLVEQRLPKPYDAQSLRQRVSELWRG